MGRRTGVFCLVWALVVSVLYLRQLAGDRAPGHRSTERPAAPAPILDPPPDEASAGQTAREEAETFRRRWEGSRTGTLRARLVDRDRDPIRMEVRLSLRGELPDGTPVSREAVTDGGGSLRIDGMRYPLRYAVTCASGELDGSCNLFLLDPGTVHDLRFALTALLRGTVAGPGGPLPGALVHYEVVDGLADDRGQGTTDAGGAFRLPLRRDLPEGASVRLAAAAPGHRPGRGSAAWAGPRLWQGDVRLEPGPALRARLVAADGTPAPGVKVMLHVERSRPADAQEPTDVQLLRLLNCGSSIETREGEPTVETFCVKLTTDDAGSIAAWYPVAPDRAWLTVGEAGGGVWIHAFDPGSAPDGTDLGDLRLPAAEPGLALRLRTDAGQPLAGVEVRFEDPEAPMFARYMRPAKTDAEGRIETTLLRRGRRYLAHVRPWSRDCGYLGDLPIRFVAADGAEIVLETK